MENNHQKNRILPLNGIQKRKIINDFVNARNSFGLEIGCNFRPLFRKSDGFSIQYLENTDTDGLIARCLKAGKDVSLVEPIDFIFDEKKSLSELTGSKNGYDYVISSHVIEHIPNLIKHFREVEDVLKPGGIYAMLVPDKNFCFDTLKSTSTLGEFVEAFVSSDAKPPLAAYVDEYRYAVKPVNATSAGWDSHWNGKLEQKHSDSDARISKAIAKSAVPPGWLGHRWIFTPFSFVSIFYDLIRYNLVQFDLLDIRPTFNLDFIAIISSKPHLHKPLSRQEALERLSKLRYAESLPRYSVPDELMLDPGCARGSSEL
jgi:SAM-dependent methyltransferase